MTYYCHLDTSGSIGATNLQLYSLQQAARYWNELHGKSDHEFSGVEDLIREQCAFTLNILGLSLSQLLGQNHPSPNKDKIDPPEILLRSLVRVASINRAKRHRLEHDIAEFIKFYDAIRHFGKK